MSWTESNGEHRAEGQYGRVYSVYVYGNRWRAEGQSLTSRTFPTIQDAKEYCEYEENQSKKG